MAKRIVTAILMCAVMALVAMVPLVSAEITIVKGPQGPRASAMTWTYEPTTAGTWKAMLDNNGLRSLVIDVYDNTSGGLDPLMHQRIRFAAYDAYPTGVIYSDPLAMQAGRLYEITATPNGPKGSYVIVTDEFMGNQAPVAAFAAAMDYLTVSVDASASSDPDGTVAEYIWEWGDASMSGSGMLATHTYAMAGTYEIVLTVVDNMGASGSAMQQVIAVEPPPNVPPVAMFDATVMELAVDVDASGSYDTDGTITEYAWAWGDGSMGTVSASPLASHTYAMGGTYTITLVVMDDDGATDTATAEVMPWEPADNPPVAMFTATVNGLTVSVDGSASTDDKGIVSWSWSWGDGMTDSGTTATHTYAPPVTLASKSVVAQGISIEATTPVPPYYVAGYTYDSMGAALGDCQLIVTNLRTGESMSAVSDALGFYMADIANGMPTLYLIGDEVSVSAAKGNMLGTATGFLMDGGYTVVDVTLESPPPVVFYMDIVLTVTDTAGQTASMTMTVELTYYP